MKAIFQRSKTNNSSQSGNGAVLTPVKDQPTQGKRTNHGYSGSTNPTHGSTVKVKKIIRLNEEETEQFQKEALAAVDRAWKGEKKVQKLEKKHAELGRQAESLFKESAEAGERAKQARAEKEAAQREIEVAQREIEAAHIKKQATLKRIEETQKNLRKNFSEMDRKQEETKKMMSSVDDLLANMHDLIKDESAREQPQVGRKENFPPRVYPSSEKTTVKRTGFVGEQRLGHQRTAPTNIAPPAPTKSRNLPTATRYPAGNREQIVNV